MGEKEDDENSNLKVRGLGSFSNLLTTPKYYGHIFCLPAVSIPYSGRLKKKNIYIYIYYIIIKLL